MQQSRGKSKFIPASEKWTGEFDVLREEHVAMESDYFVDVKTLGLFLEEASIGNQVDSSLWLRFLFSYVYFILCHSGFIFCTSVYFLFCVSFSLPLFLSL
jgi:hypothetical protein